MLGGCFRLRIVALALLALAAPLAVAGGPTKVENFGLLDHEGRFHELHRQGHRKAVVLFVQGNGCPIARKNVPILRQLRERFEPKGVEFWLINASPQDDLDEIAAEAKEWGIDFPILKDESRLVARALDFERTAEALVIDTATWTLAYRGPLDDRLGYETERPARERYLEDALERLLAGKPIAKPVRDPQGCLILLDDHGHGDGHGHHPGKGHGGAAPGQPHGAAGPPPSYAREVAPILAERCRLCHRDGGVAPWQMTDWRTVHGWAPMMREVLRTGRMPPWRIDPRYGRFANDLSLPADERATLVRWIEAGAPRGDGPDPLVTKPAEPVPGWILGEPDVIVEAPEQHVPATGIIDYRREVVDLGFDEERWIVAAQMRPSNPSVTHHALVWLVLPRAERGKVEIQGGQGNRGQFAAYVPGKEDAPFPPDTGFRVPAGSRVRFQLHYQATGRPEVDRTQLGLYFADEPPKHELHLGAASRFDFEIPPHAERHEVVASLPITRDILIYNLSPHMHFRGRSMRYDLHYPDGRMETLISVPRYDFNWQHTYRLETPLPVPTGSRLEVTAVFDNSEHNPANPDPDRAVRWGRQSYDEMLFGYFLYRERHPSESADLWRSPHGTGAGRHATAAPPAR